MGSNYCMPLHSSSGVVCLRVLPVCQHRPVQIMQAGHYTCGTAAHAINQTRYVCRRRYMHSSSKPKRICEPTRIIIYHNIPDGSISEGSLLLEYSSLLFVVVFNAWPRIYTAKTDPHLPDLFVPENLGAYQVYTRYHIIFTTHNPAHLLLQHKANTKSK